MKNSLKKSFFVLGCISTLAISADFTPPHGAYPVAADYEQPVMQDAQASAQTSKMKKTGILVTSAVVSVAAITAMVMANACLEIELDKVIGSIHKACPNVGPKLFLSIATARALIPILSTFGMVELSSYLMNKVGLKTNKLALGIVTASHLLPLF